MILEAFGQDVIYYCYILIPGILFDLCFLCGGEAKNDVCVVRVGDSIPVLKLNGDFPSGFHIEIGLAPYIKKGMAVLVRGRLNANDQGNPKVWQGENGARASYELTVEEFTFGGGGSREEAQEPARSMNDLPDLEDEDFLDF